MDYPLIIFLVIVLSIIFYLYSSRRIHSYFKNKRELVLKEVVQYEYEIFRDLGILWYSGKGISRRSRRFDGEVVFLNHSIILILHLPNGKQGKKFSQPIIQFNIDGQAEELSGISAVEILDRLDVEESRLHLFYTKDTGLNRFESKVELEFGKQVDILKSGLVKFNYMPIAD